MPENQTETLTLAEVITEVGWPDRSSLVRMLDTDPETKRLLGVVPGPRPLYPRASLPAFRVLLTAHLAGEVKPKTVPEFLRKYIQGMPEHSDTALTEQSDNPVFGQSDMAAEVAPKEMVRVLARAIREALAGTAPVADNQVLTAAEASAYLRVSRRALRRHFPPAFRIGKSAVGDRWVVEGLKAGPPANTTARPAAQPGFARNLMDPGAADRILAMDIGEEVRLMSGEEDSPSPANEGT